MAASGESQRETPDGAGAVPSSSQGHTPGPWLVEECEDGHRIRMGTALVGGVYLAQHDLVYAHNIWPGESEVEDQQYAEAEANAHLIAAAPDLLKSLKALVEELYFENQDGHYITCERCGACDSEPEHAESCPIPAAREAIRKAEGGQGQ